MTLKGRCEVDGKPEMTETDRIVNRHTARLLTQLEDANCPQIYIDAVKSKLGWLRTDLNELKDGVNEVLPSN